MLQYDIGVPPGKVARSPEEAEKVAKELSRWIPDHGIGIISDDGQRTMIWL